MSYERKTYKKITERERETDIQRKIETERQRERKRPTERCKKERGDR